jgi:hypothetical protein
MDLMNVTHVATADRRWVAYFSEKTDLGSEVHRFALSGKDWVVFHLKREPSFFLSGSGRVRARFNALDVELDSVPSEVVIKYRWLDGLRAPAPVELFPYEAASGVTLIGIRPHGMRQIPIRF